MRIGFPVPLAVCAGLALGGGACSGPPPFDLVFAGGMVVDGTGAPGVRADVAVRGSTIAAVGPDLETRGAQRVIDASGQVIAPGFWDNHAHLVTLEEHPDAENFIRQGITTILAPLHSQDQPFPMDEYRARVRITPNVGLFAGHTWIRKRVMGLENRPPTQDELDWMRALVDSTMQQGALGLSTGLEYVPAVFADVDEVVALAEVAATHGGVYVTHMRDEGARVLGAIHETLEVGRRAGIPVQINHHKVTGSAQWGSSERTLAMLDSARAAGIDVAHDVYPYTAFSTYSDLLFPAWALAEGPEAFRSRISDAETRRRIAQEMRLIFTQQAGSGPESVQFRTLEGNPDMRGRTLADYLEREGRPVTLEAAVESLIELQLAGGFIGVFHGMSEDDLRRIMKHPTAMFETDGDLVTPGVGHPHPRSYGSFPRILARYVRDEGVLTLEQAIRKMSALPAEWMGHEDRGTVGLGMVADLVVFDPDAIQDRSEYTDPHHYSDGVAYVVVNGELALDDGALTGSRSGRFLDRR